MAEIKLNSHRRLLRWSLYLLIGLAIPFCYILWKVQATKSDLFGFQPSDMAVAQYTPKDVIGDLGGMKVRIPRHYAEYVEYDGDPRFGEKRSVTTPSQRSLNSKLRSFGMNVRFPDMKGLEAPQLKNDYRSHQLKPEIHG